MSKSKHLLAQFCFRNQKRLLGNAVQPRYATTLKRISPFRVTLQALCGTKKKLPFSPQNSLGAFLWSEAASDLESALSARVFLGICWHFKILQADAGFAAQMTGENMFSQPFFCLIFSCSKTSLICSSNSSPPTACISWFSEELGKSSLPQGLGLSKAPPLLQFPAQTRQAAAASLQLPRVHHAFQGEKPRLATDPLAPSGA